MALDQLLNLLESTKDSFTKEEYETIQTIISSKINKADSSVSIYERAMDLKNEGNTHFKSKEFQKAIEKYSKAIELIDDNETFYSNRAACYQSLNQYDEAIRDCNKAIELNNAFVKAYIRLGALFLLKGDKTESKLNYEKVLALDSENQTAKEALQNMNKNVEKTKSPSVDPSNPDFLKQMQEMMKSNPDMLNKAKEMFQNMSPEEREKLLKNMPKP